MLLYQPLLWLKVKPTNTICFMYKFTLHTIYAPKRSNLPFTSIISYKLHTTYLLGQQVSYKLTFHSYVPYLELHFLMDGLGFINPVPHGPASQQNLGPADNVANDAQLLGRPKIPNDRPEGQSNLRPEGLAKHHFQFRPASSTGDTPNPFLQLLSDWRNQSHLGPTDQGCPLSKDWETNGESKAGHSS